ncbi:MAG: AraC family transcriptional regulator [Bacteroidales bacterium]|nr:AraC family transcriptional regulator [Bacteroidales bacterium]
MGDNFWTILCFSFNLVYIVTALYGWLLKRFFVPEAYRHDVKELYPARRSVAGFYLLQLFELPYLIKVCQPEALFYVNGAGLLVFSSFMLVMVENYFYQKGYSIRKRLLFLFPMWACWVALIIPVFEKSLFTPDYQLIMTIVVLVVFTGYMFMLDRFRRRLMRRVRELDEDEYSNEEDFPVKFAKSVRLLPLALCLMLVVNFLLNDVTVKMIRDIIFTVVDVWFAIYTLNPHRKLKQMPKELQVEEVEKEEVPTHRRVTDEQAKEMEAKMLELIKSEKLYLEDHFTLTDLVKRMNTNKTYLSEVIAHSEYGSFYQLINTLRIDHACWMLGEDPTLKMEQVALASGFSSGSAFSQVFKRIKGVSPSEYLREK